MTTTESTASEANPFEFATAGRIVFGKGALSKICSILEPFGSRVFLLTGRSKQRAEKLLKLLGDKYDVCTFAVGGEPTVSDVNKGIEIARNHKADVVVGFGGGSVLDFGKVCDWFVI